MSYDPQAERAAEKSEYYCKNTMGKIVCSLCGVVCGDSIKFICHLEGKKHKLHEERKLRRARLERVHRDERAAQEAAAVAATTSKLTSSITVHGRPVHNVKLEPDPDNHMCRVWIEVMYSKLADEDTLRPPILHRWVSPHEQTVETPQSGVVYLLIACEGYETIALKFPNTLQRSTDKNEMDGTYHCKWDQKCKIYSLYFTLS
eukprot:Tbor_TRINITY_DN1413_c0_g1::TRINITY_DN1413_c0_g1_i1::g.587::m.587/K12826/SF3A2, SAP62; splicing factor 3A subunit 2